MADEKSATLDTKLEKARAAYYEALQSYRDACDRYSPNSTECRRASDELSAKRQDLAWAELMRDIAAGDRDDLDPDDEDALADAVQAYQDIYGEDEDEDEDAAPEIAKNWVPSLPSPKDWTLEELERLAIESRNMGSPYNIVERLASPDGTNVDPAALDRWVRNYVRHTLSDYDSILAAMEGKPGRASGYRLAGKKIDQAIDDFLCGVDHG